MNPLLAYSLKKVGIDLLLRLAGDPRVLAAVTRGTDARARAAHGALDAVAEWLAAAGLASGADVTALSEEVATLGDEIRALTGALERLEATLSRLHEAP